MNTDHIRYFLEVLQCGSINKASEKLNINHQHLGRILTALEDEIGAKLLKRSRVGVMLTPQGIEVLDLLKNIDLFSQKLSYYFSVDPHKNQEMKLKIYTFAMTNYATQDKFMMNLQEIMPNLMIDVNEAWNLQIIENMLNDKTAALGALCSFDDYPALNLKVDILPEQLEIVSERMGRIVMLVSANNPIFDKYDTISMESLIAKPLVFYSPYDIEMNHFYKIMKLYGTPCIKYVVGNLQTFYDLLRNTDCVAIGGTSDKLDALHNPLFRKEEQYRMIPVRENISFKIIRVVNELLKKKYDTVVRKIIDRHFG